MNNYFLRLGLAPASEFTALAAVQREEREAGRALYLLRHSRRFPPGTAYAAIAGDVARLAATPPLDFPVLVVDRAGVGRAVADLISSGTVRARLMAVTVHGGQSLGTSGGLLHLPKQDLVGCLQVLLQGRRLRVARGLADAELLVRELEGFRMRPAGGEGLDVLREGVNDDLVIAVALACWAGERGGAFEVPLPVEAPRETLEERLLAGQSRAAERGLFGMRSW